MKLNAKVIFIVIFILATTLRLYQFGRIPTAVNRDEASIGYTAKLLLETGADEHGVKWPLEFESFGDWKQPLYIYLTIPFVWLFGLSATTVRMVSLIAGLMLIASLYWLSKNKTIGIMAALFLTVNPWHFHFSHLALEALVATCLVTVGIVLLLKKSSTVRLMGLLCFVLSLWTYHAAIVIVPLWFGTFLIMNHKYLRSKKFVLGVVGCGIVLLLILAHGMASREKSKVTGTTIFAMTQDEQWQEIYQYRTGNIVSKIIHNQYFFYVATIAKNYVRAFSPDFLLIKGGTHPHYNVPGIGNFYVIEIMLCLIGSFAVIKTKNKTGMAFVSLLAIAPLASAITRDGIRTTRDIFMIPAVQIVAAYGFVWILAACKTKKYKIVFTSLVLASLSFQAIPFVMNYWTTYPAVSELRFSGYMRDISLFLSQHRQEYKTIYITFPFESPYMFYAFYNRLNTGDFVGTVQYYPIDELGFRHASSLLNMKYYKSTKDVLKLPVGELANSLIIAHKQEISGVIPALTWGDVIAWDTTPKKPITPVKPPMK